AVRHRPHGPGRLQERTGAARLPAGRDGTGADSAAAGGGVVVGNGSVTCRAACGLIDCIAPRHTQPRGTVRPCPPTPPSLRPSRGPARGELSAGPRNCPPVSPSLRPRTSPDTAGCPPAPVSPRSASRAGVWGARPGGQGGGPRSGGSACV